MPPQCPQGPPDLFEVVHGEGQVLQGEQQLLQEGNVVGGLGARQPRVEQLVPPDPDEPEGKKGEFCPDSARKTLNLSKSTRIPKKTLLKST